MRLLPWIVLGTGVYLIWRAKRLVAAGKIPVPLKVEPPPGSRPTGRVKRTGNSNKPGDPTERLSYTIREFVEVMLPDGAMDWFEIDRSKLPY